MFCFTFSLLFGRCSEEKEILIGFTLSISKWKTLFWECALFSGWICRTKFSLLRFLPFYSDISKGTCFSYLGIWTSQVTGWKKVSGNTNLKDMCNKQGCRYTWLQSQHCRFYQIGIWLFFFFFFLKGMPTQLRQFPQVPVIGAYSGNSCPWPFPLLMCHSLSLSNHPLPPSPPLSPLPPIWPNHSEVGGTRPSLSLDLCNRLHMQM